MQLLDKLEKMPVDADTDDIDGEEVIQISEADIYLETRKRDDKREYKIPAEMAKAINEKIVSPFSRI